MKLLALAVLLAVLQTSAPVPRKAPDPSNRAAQNVKSNSNGNQSPAQQPQTIVQPISVNYGAAVTGAAASVSVLGSGPGGPSALIYNWTVASAPVGGAAAFSANGTSAACNTTVG